MKQCILIIGLSGNGKKSIQKSILDEMKLEKERFCEQNPLQLKKEETKINVIIVPENGDLSTADDQEMRKQIDKILTDYNGIDAIIFVLKFGVRFTRQEKNAVEKTKTLFGNKVFGDHVILAFSYGDNFNDDSHDSNEAFQKWCQQQTGEIQNLFTEVKNRCILFNNTSTGKQVKSLLNLINIQGEDGNTNEKDDSESPANKKKKGNDCYDKDTKCDETKEAQSVRTDDKLTIVPIKKQYTKEVFQKVKADTSFKEKISNIKECVLQ